MPDGSPARSDTSCRVSELLALYGVEPYGHQQERIWDPRAHSPSCRIRDDGVNAWPPYLEAASAQAFANVAGVKPAALKHRLKPNARTRITPAQMRQLCEAPSTETLLGQRDRALLATLASSGGRR